MKTYHDAADWLIDETLTPVAHQIGTHRTTAIVRTPTRTTGLPVLEPAPPLRALPCRRHHVRANGRRGPPDDDEPAARLRVELETA